MSYCRFLVWLLITGWLTQKGGDIRASVLHSSCTIQILCCPAVPPVCAGSADGLARNGTPCFTQQGRLLCGPGS